MPLDRLIEQNQQEPSEYAFGRPSVAKKPLFNKLSVMKLILSSQLILGSVLFPVVAHASILSIFGIGEAVPVRAMTAAAVNSQTLALPQATIAAHTAKDSKTEETELAVADDNALVAQTGPLGTVADIEESYVPETMSIYTYVVRSGDSLPIIANMLDVSVGTIVWANDLSGKNAKLTPGQVLTILPVSGISYTIKKGDTVSSLAKKFKVDADEIGRFNGLESDSKLVVGDEIIIPGAELESSTKITTSTKSNGSSGSIKTNSNLPVVAYGPTRLLPGHDGPDIGNYYIRPVAGCSRTQGAHGANGVDIACPKGQNNPILAAASGTVLIAKQSGWNGGFGNYVVINHPNGTQTLYGHMSTVDVSPGQSVSQGQPLGLMGSTGRSTGKHVHFEVHGAKNPLATDARYGL